MLILLTDSYLSWAISTTPVIRDFNYSSSSTTDNCPGFWYCAHVENNTRGFTKTSRCFKELTNKNMDKRRDTRLQNKRSRTQRGIEPQKQNGCKGPATSLAERFTYLRCNQKSCIFKQTTLHNEALHIWGPLCWWRHWSMWSVSAHHVTAPCSCFDDVIEGRWPYLTLFDPWR